MWEDSVVRLGGGGEQRSIFWSDALRYYDANTPNLTLAQYLQIEKHFNARRGRGRSFKLRDRSSYRATTEAFGVGDGSTTVFQLSVASGDSGNAYAREIYLPENGTISIFDNASPVSPTITYTGANAGRVTFSPAPTTGHVLTWSGDYWIPVRYDTKELDPKLFIWRSDGTGLVEGPSIPLVEVRYVSEFA